MHYHVILEGEGPGNVLSHTHPGGDERHEHPPSQVFPLRADGGYRQVLGGSFTEPPPLPADVLKRIAGILARARPKP